MLREIDGHRLAESKDVQSDDRVEALRKVGNFMQVRYQDRGLRDVNWTKANVEDLRLFRGDELVEVKYPAWLASEIQPSRKGSVNDGVGGAGVENKLQTGGCADTSFHDDRETGFQLERYSTYDLG